MTGTELRVLEARMELLEELLQDLIDQVCSMQPSSWASRHRAVSALSGRRFVHGCLEVLPDGLEDRAGHEFVGLREANPADLG